MGYNDFYRRSRNTSSDPSRLSGGGAPTITLSRDSSGSYSRIADVSVSKGQLTVPQPDVAGHQHWKKYAATGARFARLVLKAHPYMRAFHFGMDLFELYRQYYQPTNMSNGSFTEVCSVDIASGCTNLVPCGPTSYCAGPVFGGGGANDCGVAGQAIGAGYQGSFPVGPKVGASYTVGVFMLRPGAPTCHPGRKVRSYNANSFPTGGKKQMFPPHKVHNSPVQFPPLKKYRWLAPEVLQKPLEYAPEPEAPPYEIIPDREMGPNSERGSETASELQRWEPTAFRSPPGRRSSERKFKSTATAEALQYALIEMSKGLGKLTDLRDLIGALHDALPDELQLKGKEKKLIPDLLRRVAANLDKIDGEKALLNIIKELAEDVVGGVSDSYAAAAAREFGWFKQKFFLSARF